VSPIRLDPLPVPHGLGWNAEQCFKSVNSLRAHGFAYTLSLGDDDATLLVGLPDETEEEMEAQGAAEYLGGAEDLAEFLFEEGPS
jgi:hypothetical protein